jgi:hypothetical protein
MLVAGFFLDGAHAVDGAHNYRNNFIGADPVWNVTGSGGTNLACLADQKAGEAWKCLMAPFIAKYVKTPIFVMNSAYDAWQMGNILGTACIPTPTQACTGDQNATLRAYRDQFVSDIKAVTDGKPANGVYVDGCYVHEQNVNYCSSQGMPNCVGWSPLESGSIKWGYSTSVAVPDGRSLTPQQAFGAWYRGDKAAGVAVDGHAFFDNPSCVYLGKPAPPPPAPPTPAPAYCEYFGGGWIDNTSWFTPVQFTQADAVTTADGLVGATGVGCRGSFASNTYSVNAGTLQADPSFHGGLTGVLQVGTGLPGDTADVLEWSNGIRWERNCSDVGGAFRDKAWAPSTASMLFAQHGCSGSFNPGAPCAFTVHGDRVTTCDSFYNGLAGILAGDTITWGNGDQWTRATAPSPAPAPVPLSFSHVHSDGMVLQRAPHAASVWGWAAPGSAVTVSIVAPSSGPGGEPTPTATASGTAGADGAWRVSLAPQPASTAPVSIVATTATAGGAQSTNVSDVLFGDVYVCSGVSARALEWV